jgi:hypothetical protein
MAFNVAAVNNLIAAVESIAMTTGQFRRVNTHEPKSAPGAGLTLAIWAQSIEPVAEASGLASTSGYVVLQSRIYLNMLVKPEDSIDPRMMAAATVLLGAYSADFTLGGTVKNIDLLGMYGTPMRAQAGYIQIDNSMQRVYDIMVPCVVNDMWTQTAGA